ncbi:hypothetical protein [Paracoccus sp. (in: a-proteobacteria)]|uniref:hypothetical protein n=1 Tax=Paracoccus sp. TaxID=267 RepID=UPI003A875940
MSAIHQISNRNTQQKQPARGLGGDTSAQIHKHWSLPRTENRGIVADAKWGVGAGMGAELAAGQSGLRGFDHEVQSAANVKMAAPAPGRGDEGNKVEGKPADPGKDGIVQNGTVFEIGENKRPDIHHDNGFLQNPDDPNDPEPMPTRKPTKEEKEFYDDQVFEASLGNSVKWMPLDFLSDQLALDHAIPAYKHFLTGEGKDREFDYAAYLDNDESGKKTKDRVLSDTRTAADQLYGDLDEQVGQNPGDSVTFKVRSDAMTTEMDSGLPYPKSEDWQKALGGHSFWSSADVTVTRNEDGTLKASADVTIHAEDRYNFNPGQKDIKTKAPDEERGVFEETGLAHQYTQTGEATYTTEWEMGDPGGKSVKTDEKSGGR